MKYSKIVFQILFFCNLPLIIITFSLNNDYFNR